MNKVSFIPKHIITCCVLHNACLMRDDELAIEIKQHKEMIDEEANIEHYHDATNTDVIKRDLICQRLEIRHTYIYIYNTIATLFV